ncbi:MAG: hypothetical protein BWY59_02542 [Verrucomicrobia bacterium ADurb.Bin345]|nr:MAG: hypothetical protein BWY59_02542 [Verrucomicrobia bacterium ADurb.Bin345]
MKRCTDDLEYSGCRAERSIAIPRHRLSRTGRSGRLAAILCLFGACLCGAQSTSKPPMMQRKLSATDAEEVSRPVKETSRRRHMKKPPMAMPFHIINYRLLPAVENFAASGFMGDVSDVRLAGSYEGTREEGFPCLRVKYAALGEAGWAGVMWQNPANNWGTVDGGYNLGRAKRLSFWARGERGGEVVEFIVGGASAVFPDSDGLTTGDVTLRTDWTHYHFDLSQADLSYISSGFGFVIKQDENPRGCTFFLDEVRYQE